MTTEVHDSAQDLEDYLKTNHQATVAELAEATELSEDEVIAVLDTHYVDEEGKIEQRGPGLGGGWHAARVAEQQRIDEGKARLDVMIKERQEILDNLSEDASPAVRANVQAMIDQLEAQKTNL